MPKANILTDYLTYYRNQKKAHNVVNRAIKKGELTRPDTCELCGTSPAARSEVVSTKGRTFTPSGIFGHHWRGYEGDATADVWWLCHDCNLVLSGPEFHNGSISKEEARAYIASLK